MPAGIVDHMLHHLRRTVLLPTGGGLTDGQLLDGFVARQDEAAFEALVRRHGPMVLGVCRRVIGHEADAEDAFQAAFLVLVRRAATIIPREKVGNWLYGVAYRTALEARTMLIRRRNKEKQMTDMLDSRDASKMQSQELSELLDRELSRLPEKYRLPVVLCELEGRSRKEVARQLRLPEGTLSSRLATARKMLARRLKASSEPEASAPGGFAALKGLTLPALTTDVPSSLLRATVQTATTLAKGGAPAAGLVSAKVISLTEGVCKAMFLAKLKMTAVVVLTILTAGVGAGLLTHQGLADQPAQPKSQEAAKPVAKADKLPPDKDNLQGTWMLVAREEDGKRQEFPQGVGILLIFDKDTMTTREESVGLFQNKSGSTTKGSYALRSETSPKEIDLLYQSAPKKDQPWKRGIYFLGYAADLVICWGDEDSRPTKFATTESKWVLNVFRRVDTDDGKPATERAPENWKIRLDVDTGHKQQVSSVAFSPDGKMLATGSLDMTVKLWDAASGKEIAALPANRQANFPVRFVVFSPDGRLLAAAGGDKGNKPPGNVLVWKTTTRKLQFVNEGHIDAISSVAFSPDGRLLASAGGDSLIRLSASANGKILAIIQGHGGLVSSVAFSPDGKRLASASLDKTVRVWDMALDEASPVLRLRMPNGKQLSRISHEAPVRAVAFSPDGKILATAGEDKKIRLLDAVFAKEIAVFHGHQGDVLSLAFSPDGRTLASAGGQDDGTVKLWDLTHMKQIANLSEQRELHAYKSGPMVDLIRQLATLPGHQHPVTSIAFSPGGNTLATAGDGTHVKLWSRELLQPRTK